MNTSKDFKGDVRVFRFLDRLGKTASHSSRQTPQLKPNKKPLEYCRFLTYWKETDLPIMPRVSFAHQQLTKIIASHVGVLSEELIGEFKNNLGVVRGVNWHKYNVDNIGMAEAQEAKKKLQKLISLEKKLPASLKKELGDFSAFNDLRGAVDCLDERCGMKAVLSYKK